MKKLDVFFEARKDYGLILLRFVIAWRLIAGTWTYVVQSSSISEVTSLFTQLNLPIPAVCAFLSVYTQFIAGILFLLGLWIRPAALVMIINFTIAIIAAHMNDNIGQSFDAWAILAASVVFLFYGAGKPAVRFTKQITSRTRH